MKKYKNDNAKTRYVHDFYPFISEIIHLKNHDSIVILTLFFNYLIFKLR